MIHSVRWQRRESVVARGLEGEKILRNVQDEYVEGRNGYVAVVVALYLLQNKHVKTPSPCFSEVTPGCPMTVPLFSPLPRHLYQTRAPRESPGLPPTGSVL